jgi:subtilisin-like proprotein convertase family protein
MFQAKCILSIQSDRDLGGPSTRVCRVLSLTAALLTLLWLPAQGQIRGRSAGAGQENLHSLSGASAVSDLDCDPNSEGDFCVTAECGAGGDPSCHTPEIPDLATVTSEINISRAILDALQLSDCTILDVNAAVEIEHTFVGDLEIRLEKVSGPATVLLEQGDGSLFADGDVLDVLFDDERSLPEGGGYRVARPASPLSVFDARSMMGIWRLRIEDQLSFDSGQLHDWGLSFAVDCPEITEPTGCVEDATTMCLNEDRFRVTASYRTASGDTGSGRAVELTDDTGYFWFFDRTNVEVVTKVLDACSFADRFWVFAAGLTNVEVDLAVVDTRTGAFTGYRNALNEAFKPIQDTDGLPTCP